VNLWPVNYGSRIETDLQRALAPDAIGETPLEQRNSVEMSASGHCASAGLRHTRVLSASAPEPPDRILWHLDHWSAAGGLMELPRKDSVK
jgi:hypothetical protein